jgi:ketopantoate hydroxymethyltransferase
MAMHGFDSTVHADIPLMKPHIEAVARGDKFIVGDMPFLSCSRGLAAAIDGAQTLIEAGSMAIKIERHTHQVDIIDHIVDAGVPVIGHIGLPPQGRSQPRWSQGSGAQRGQSTHELGIAGFDVDYVTTIDDRRYAAASLDCNGLPIRLIDNVPTGEQQ